MTFTEAEHAYLTSQFLGRLATVGPNGTPHVRPVGYRLNTELDALDIVGPRMSSSQKWRNLRASPRASIVIDDMTPNDPNEIKPGWGRGVEIRGRAELLTGVDPGREFASNEIIRIHPERVISWHIDAENPEQHSRNVA